MLKTLIKHDLLPSLLTFVLLFGFFTSYAQLPKGLIADPATGTTRIVLDPNLDGWISATGAAFIANDGAESEIIYKKMPIVSEPNSDLGSGPNCGYTDFVYDSVPANGMTLAGGYYLDADNNWLIRVRLSRLLPNAKSYSVLIDTDLKMGATGTNLDQNWKEGNPGFEIELLLSTANPGGIRVYDCDNQGAGEIDNSDTVWSRDGHGYYQRSVAKSNECGDEDAFLDFFVPFSVLTTHFGITTSTPLRWALTDNMSADVTTIGHLPNISDLWGSSKYNEAAIVEVIENFPPTCAACDEPKRRTTTCSAINSPIAVGATTISGTGVNGDTIKLYKYHNLSSPSRVPNSSTYAIVSGGTWSFTGLSGIVSGDTIGASTTHPGFSESISNCNLVAVQTCGTVATLVGANITGNAKGFCGAAGTGIDNASVGLYINGVRRLPSTGTDTFTVITDGSFLWKDNASNTNCNSGSGSLSGNGMATQTVSGCESAGVCVNFTGSAVTTVAPVITTNPIINGTTPITGTCVSATTVYLYADGVQIGTQTPAGTSWSITPSPALSTGQVITAKAQSSTECLSAASTSVTVSRQAVAPLITGNYCGSPVTTVSGTSVEASGTKILLYDNGVLEDSTTVDANGDWTRSVANFTGPITAKARLTGGTLSDFSTSQAVGAKTTDGSLSITTSPITDALTSVSGNGTTGNTVRLYVDGVQVGSNATVSGGTWTVSGLTAGSDLFQGGIVTATSSSGSNCESDAVGNVTITCVTPTDLGVTASVSTCQGSIATGILINNSQAGTFYQLYNGSDPFGTVVVGTGGTISLSSGTVTTTMTGLTVKAIKSSSCQTTFSGTVGITIDPPDSCWYGRVSTDWFDPRNWCLSGNIPTQFTKTYILSSATYMPIINAAGAVCDTMIINSGATVTAETNENLDVHGGWTNNGTFTANSGTVSFKDANGQIIKGTSVTSFNNLTINNTSSVGVTLQQDVTVTGLLTLTDGNINTTSTDILNLTSTATSTSGSTASFVDGPMTKAGTTTFLFPVGDATLYAPIEIGTPSSSSTYKAEYFSTAFNNTTSMAGSPSPVLTNVSQTEYWGLDRTAGSGTATVGLYWDNTNNGSSISNCTDLREAFWNGTSWENNNDANTTTGGCPSTGNITTNTAVTTFATSNTFYTFGSTSSQPLPVKLVSFNSECIDKDVKLKWETASEINNEYFIVEKGTHPSRYTPIGKVLGAGNSNQLLSYAFIDKDALITKHADEILYYRLKQTDFNGDFAYSKDVIVTHCDDANRGVDIYPNPSDGHLQVINKNRLASGIEIYNLVGTKVYSSAITGTHADLVIDLPEGMYYYLFINKDEQVGKGKLLIK